MIDAIVDVIAVMMAAYERQPSPDRIAIYAKVLFKAGYNAAEVADAVDKLLLASKFCPSINEIAVTIDEAREFNNPNRMLTWTEAWQMIYGQIGSPTPHFEKPEVKEAVEIYGWDKLCKAEEKDMDFVRASVWNIYDGICKNRAVERRNHFMLTGSKAKENVKMIDEAIKGVVKSW